MPRNLIFVVTWMWLVSFTVYEISARGTRPGCGGVFTAARGILQTPGFPAPFQTPIFCEWVIDKQLFDDQNSSIIIYLSQLFLAEGLSFTEYQVYERQFQLAGKEVHKVDETNIAKVRYLQSFQNYLVVRLKLDSAYGSHLRVLDHFLDVHGFNITYEISTTGPRADACSMMDCGFTGTCYDYYNRFQCVCLPGYEGKHCSKGPSSYCQSGKKPTCLNGGTCLHVGAAAVKCVCTRGFTGETCEFSIADAQAKGCENCLISCPLDQKLNKLCQCVGHQAVNESQKFNFEDGIGLSATMQLANFPKLKDDSLRLFLTNQISKSLELNNTKIESVFVKRKSRNDAEGEVTIHLSLIRGEEKHVRSLFSRWFDRGYITNITVANKPPMRITSRTLLNLQSVSINVPNEVREGDEFILSCVARGSPNMSFRWLKDGLIVNVTRGTRGKWSRLIRDPHVSDQYTALLGVQQPQLLDQGTFTCQVEDVGLQQCRSRSVRVIGPPRPRIEPVSLTAHKGDNFTVKCVCAGHFTYSWTKNRVLLPVHTESERYEILYPGGSLLQVYRIERDTTYSCLVQGVAGSDERIIKVSVVDDTVKTCPGERLDDVLWPETAPDTDCLQECPKGYHGRGPAQRTCALSSLAGPTWLIPDFSACIPQVLYQRYMDFENVRLGYGSVDPLEIVESYWDYLEHSYENKTLPGEGSSVFRLATQAVAFIQQLKNPHHTHQALILYLQIIDRLFLISNSLVTLQQVEHIQKAVKEQLTLGNSLLLDSSKAGFHHALTTLDLTVASIHSTLHIPLADQRYENWYNFELQISLKPEEKEIIIDKSDTIISIIYYKNITAFLPKRSAIRQNDIETEYEIISSVIGIWSNNPSRQFQLTMQFHHVSIDSDRKGWILSCATAETAMGGNDWQPEVCHTIPVKDTITRCSCPGPGTVALLQIADPEIPSTERVRPLPYVLAISCAVCLLLCLINTLILMLHWAVHRSSLIFLKLQSALCGVVAMSVFLTAISMEPSSTSFMIYISALGSTLLLGLSAHLSMLLVVWTEVVPVPRVASRPSVAAISTGLPVLAVFGNHLAHRTMNVKPTFWWLKINSLSFTVFISTALLVVLLFLPLHFMLLKKMRNLKQLRENFVKSVKTRGGLLRRSAYVFVVQFSMTIASVLYVNAIDSLWSQYVFSFVSVLLGVTMLVCYCILPEASIRQFFSDKLKQRKTKHFFKTDNGSPLNFFTKQEPEVESESIPKVALTESTQLPNFMVRPCGLIKPVVMNNKPRENTTGKITSTSFCENFPPETTTELDDLQLYQSSPQLSRKINEKQQVMKKLSEQLSPDILGDLGGGETSSNNGGAERSQPDGKERDKLDGMLDSISHDLDYLLNRAEDVQVCVNPSPSPVSVRTVPRTMDLIKEEPEEEGKVPDSITDILRTSC